MTRTPINKSLYKTIKNWQNANRDELAMRVRALALYHTFHDIPADVYAEWQNMKTALLTMNPKG